MASAHEHFSEQFQKWEMRGRGWQVFPEPVYPEPPFVPFKFRPMSESSGIDDGRRPTFLSSLARKLARPTSTPPIEPEEEPEPTPLVRNSVIELQAALPEDLDLGAETFQQFFRNLALCHEPVAFELIGSYRRVLAQFAAAEEDVSLVRKQLSAHFPEIQFSERQDTLKNAWLTSEGDDAFAVEFGLESEFMLPLATGHIDPFAGIVAALSELQPGELGLYQVLWQPVQNPWAESIVDAVTYADGKPLFINAPELTSAAETKAEKSLFAVVVRILARTTGHARLNEIARDLATAMRVFANPAGNALIPMHNADYPYLEHLEDVICRQSRRAGMLLGGDELAYFVHLPSSDVRSAVLLRDAGLTKAAPGIVRQPPGVVIGDNEHNSESVPVYLTADQRVRHTHIIGSSGTGKSSLLLNMIRQDIDNGDGIGVLDPHGDLINQILTIIPDERIDDVVLVDPSDTEFPVGFNILSAHSEDEKSLLSSDLIAVFRRLSTSWGDQMDTVLQNAILAFLNSSQGGTLSDLRLFLLDTKGTGFKRQFLGTVTDPEVVFFWRNVFPELTGNKSIGPVLTRLQDFFTRKPLRNMVGQTANKLDFADIMDSGKIFLARLPEGCGEENSYLLGTLLVSKFQQLAMARQSQAAAARRDFWLYIDEFDHFITPSMAKILSGVRKYRLGFTLAHQNLHQLQSDSNVASAVMTQPCTRVVFNVGDDDAKKLGDGFASFDAKSLKALPKYHAIVRVERNDCDFNLAIRKPELIDEADAQSQRDKVIAASRSKYAAPRTEVEAVLLARIWGDKSTKPTEKPTVAPTPKPPVGPIPGSQKVKEPAKDSLDPMVPEPSTTTESEPSSVSVSEPQQILEPPKRSEIPKPLESPTPPRVEAVAAEQKPTVTVSEEKSSLVFEAKPSDASAAPPKPAISETKAPREDGRGLTWHRSVVKRLKTEADKRGFTSDKEKQLEKGSMEAADLVLRRGHLAIAVEIGSSGTSVNHEFENIQKCLNAGFSRVAAIAAGRSFLEKLSAAVLGALGPDAAAQVGYYTPDEFLDELRKLAPISEQAPAPLPLPATEMRDGFEIERNFPQQQTPEEIKATQQGIHDVITKTMARKPSKS